MSHETSFKYEMVDDIRTRFLNEAPLRKFSITQKIRRARMLHPRHHIRFVSFDTIPKWDAADTSSDAAIQTRIKTVAFATGGLVAEALGHGMDNAYAVSRPIESIRFTNGSAAAFVDGWATQYAQDFMTLRKDMLVNQTRSDQ